MKSVIAVISISTGGVLRIGRAFLEYSGIRAGDKLVVLKDVKDGGVTIQIQRGNKIILQLRDAVVQPWPLRT